MFIQICWLPHQSTSLDIVTDRCAHMWTQERSGKQAKSFCKKTNTKYIQLETPITYVCLEKILALDRFPEKPFENYIDEPYHPWPCEQIPCQRLMVENYVRIMGECTVTVWHRHISVQHSSASCSADTHCPVHSVGHYLHSISTTNKTSLTSSP